MSSIIQDLQIEATDQSNSCSDLLRKAKIVAVKLDLEEFAEWIEKELNGYKGFSNKDLPDYRIVSGEPKAWNPYHGWQPILFGDTEAGDIMAKRGVMQPIGELDDLAKTDSSTFMIDYNTSAKKQIMEAIGFETDIKFMIGRTAVTGILDGVRNLILDWALRLEKAGVAGEGISFSKEDKERAKITGDIYNVGHIENFAGTLGNVSDDVTLNVHQINTKSIEEIKKLTDQINKYTPDIDLPIERKSEVNDIVTELKNELSKKSPEQSNIKLALRSLKTIFEAVAGNVIAQGIIVEISKYIH
ncbi:MAG: hypothetical protein WC603_02890 [Candidatus Paceibacterota bacterium]|jgi:hypothetical protein